MADFLIAPTPHEEAVDFIKSKPAVSRAVFNKLLPELKARAFTIAGIEPAAVLQTVRDLIAELPAGGDWHEQKKAIVAELSPYMVSSDDPEIRAREENAAERRAELLLRTHGQQAYAAASYRVMDAQRGVFTFWQYQTLGDSHVRSTHAALDGIVMPADSVFWQTHFPPWDWGCRCQAIPLSDADVQEIQAADAHRAPEARQFLEERDQLRLEQQNVLVRHADPANKKGAPTPINVQAPSEQGKPGAWRWHPGSLRLSLDELRSRYDADIFAQFQKWAMQTPIPELKRTVWEWLSGETILPPTAPVALPPPAAPATFADVLAGLGLHQKVAWAPADVEAILGALRKPGAVDEASKISAIKGAKKSGPLSQPQLRSAMQGLLNLLPPEIARTLPAIEIRVRASMSGARGAYNNSTHVLELNAGSLGKDDPARQLETIWHEMMHWVHLHGPQSYRDAVAAHFQARTAAEPVISLPGYGSRGKRDKWYDAYAGRIYSHLGETGTEVPTRYFQLFANPQKFVDMLSPLHNAHAGTFLETVQVVMSIFT